MYGRSICSNSRTRRKPMTKMMTTTKTKTDTEKAKGELSRIQEELASMREAVNTQRAIEFLKRPYARKLTPDVDGGFVATIQEFPGCIAEGDTADEALTRLESAAQAWIEAQLAAGQDIPPPVDVMGYSGKIALRIPRGIHKQVAQL